MKYNLFKKLAVLGMTASVSLSAIAPAFAAEDSNEDSVIEAENTDSGSDDETPPTDEEDSSKEDETPSTDEDTSKEDETPSTEEDTSKEDETPSTDENSPKEDETPSTGEDTSNKDETPSTDEDTSKEEQTPSTDEDTSKEEQTPSTGEDTSNEEETPSTGEDTPNEDETPSTGEDTSNKEQTPSTGEDTPKEEQTPSTDENTSKEEQTPSTDEETPSDKVEEEQPSTPTTKPSGYEEVTQAGNKGNSLVTLEIVNDGSGGDNPDKPNPNPNPGGDGEDPNPNPNPGGGEDPDNPGGDPDPMIFSAYVPSKLPMKLDQNGNVLTPSKAAIINGVTTKGIAVKDIEAHLDFDWDAEDWEADYPNMPVNTKKVGLKLRGDTLSKDGDFSVNAEDWKIPKDSYIDLNMEAKLPPQKIETATQNSDVAVLSFTLDWSGDDTTTGPKWEGGTLNPDKPNDNTTTASKPNAESNDLVIVGGSGDIHITWDAKEDTVTLDSVTSSNTDVVTVGSITGENGNKTASVNGLKSGTSIITATLSNGKAVTYEVIVYEVGNLDDIKVSVSDKKFNVGDSITSNDVTANVPLVAPDGSTKTMTVKPSVDTNTLQAGNNTLTGTVTVGGQDYSINFDVAVENPDSNKSNIKAESTDTLVEGETGEVTFTWDTQANTITLKDITSSNESIVTVGSITGADGSKKVTVNALAYGKATITATLNNGETATFEAEVHKIGNASDIQVTVTNPDLGAGDTVTSNDITVKVPVISPDGDTKYIEKTPSIEDTVLQVGDNTVTGTVTVGGQDYPIDFTVTAEIPDDMKSGLKAEVNDLVISGGNGNVNFTWDTKGNTVTLSGITSSNQSIANVGNIAGEEGNKTAAVNGLQSGVSTITATLSNGETASIDIPVHIVDTSKEMQVEVADKTFTEGNTLSSDDVTVKVPLTAPDGSTKYMTTHPNIENAKLEEGTNTITGTVTAGGNTYNVTITINVAAAPNPSNGLVMSVPEAQAAGWTFDVYKEGVQITGFKNVAFKSSINVPNQIGDFEVLKVGDNVFQNQTNLKEITLPNSVTEIGNSSFAGCSGLPSFNTNKVTSIGTSAFSGCTKLKNLTIPKDATIGTSAFDGCTGLEELHTNKLSSIGTGAFANCTGLKTLDFGDNLTSIGPRAFADCTGLTELNTHNVASIGNNAFEGCSNLSKLNFEDNLTSIGNNAFQDCDSLSNVEITNTDIQLGEAVFKGDNVDLSIPLEVVNTGCFSGQKGQGIERLDIKIVKETKLAANALKECMWKEITLPNGTTEIGTSAFANSKVLTAVNYPSTVTTLGGSAFSGCTALTDVTIPGTVKTIGSSAFKGCTGITNLKFSNGITSIGTSAFEGCTGLTEVELLISRFKTGTLKNVPSRMFYGCTNLKSVGFDWGIKTIGASAFENCTSLKYATIQNGVQDSSDLLTEIGSRAFANTKVYNMGLPGTITTIGQNAFAGCSDLKNITFFHTGTTHHTISGSPWGASNATVKWSSVDK